MRAPRRPSGTLPLRGNVAYSETLRESAPSRVCKAVALLSKADEFIELSKKQLNHEIAAIRTAFSHSVTKGAESERRLVEALLQRHMPRRYSFGSGFVECRGELTPQLDIIVHDMLLNVPLYSGLESSVFRVGAVYGAIEVTIQRVDREKLGQDIRKLSTVRKIVPERRVGFLEVYSAELHDKPGAFVVQSRPLYAKPVPRAYIVCLCGSAYSTPESMSAVVRELAQEHGAHIHGTLVLNDGQPDWYLQMDAFAEAAITVHTEQAVFRWIASMQQAFLGMNVGRLPALID